MNTQVTQIEYKNPLKIWTVSNKDESFQNEMFKFSKKNSLVHGLENANI